MSEHLLVIRGMRAQGAQRYLSHPCPEGVRSPVNCPLVCAYCVPLDVCHLIEHQPSTVGGVIPIL